MSGSIVSSTRGSLSPQKALKLANMYLESADNVDDDEIALVLCHDTEISLKEAKKAVRRVEDQYLIQEIADVYVQLGDHLNSRGHPDEAKVSYQKAGKLGVNVQSSGRLSKIMSSMKGPSLSVGGYRSVATIPAHIFADNVHPPVMEFNLPEPDERLNNTPQLAYCLCLLKTDPSSDDIFDSVAQKWVQTTKKDVDEQERLTTIATEVIRTFKRDEFKDAKVVAEVVYLAPALDKEVARDLLCEFYSGIDRSGLLKIHQLEGLAQLIQGADQGHLNADDLVKILGLLSDRLKDTHKQSSEHMHHLTLAVSHVLDAMADTNITGLSREMLLEPLSTYLKELRRSKDPYLIYQAAYAHQALLCVPDNEPMWQTVLRRTGKVIFGLSGVAKALREMDLPKFFECLDKAGAAEIVHMVATAYEGVTLLVESGKGFRECLKESFGSKGKRAWYSALQGADVLIRNGELASFRELVCEGPCRLDPAFQWGVCQRLGEIAANPMWNEDIRRSAIEFLGEIYRNDEVWGQHVHVKQWALNILMQLASPSETQPHQAAETLLVELESSGDDKKQMVYRACRKEGPVSYPLKVSLSELASPSLLDRVQNRPDVECNIRQLRKQRTMERGNAVYIPPQAKASLEADDDARFPLMEKVKEFLDSDQKVFLLLGDSGSGKSTFNRELEHELWQSYKNRTGRIPLHIHLPAIDKPEHDMIVKQLRKADFSDHQILEMKHYRKFILICDGYDECQQTHNLYTNNRLNQAGEWDAQMVISCRTEYLGSDHYDRFQPVDRNQQSDSSLFQEAVLTPFSIDQVEAYIQQYVVLHNPMWQSDDYRQALKLIPSLRDLVRNPFLMALSLEVLPRMVDHGHLSKARVTRVGLYDHFVEQWLERSKKRIGEKDLTQQARAAFESLCAEGFVPNGIEYLKKLAVAIYKEQGGHPVIQYSRLVHEGSWKDAFFSQEDRKLLREACPLTQSGNQHRFIHRSLLEYAFARAIYDPLDGRKIPEPVKVRPRTVSPTMSFDMLDLHKEKDAGVEPAPDWYSPLVGGIIVNNHSVLQFLEERVQQEPAFKSQLLNYIELSKKDKKWREAAANAITILVRAGEQFIGADLKNIRIPEADLSYGVFDSAQLQNADLRGVILRGVWLRQADLSGAQMKNVQFGEIPYRTEDRRVRSCAYSPDGKSIAVGFFDGNISVYLTSTWERTRMLSGHSDMVRRVVFSSKGDQIASASYDTTVRLWDVDTGTQLHALQGHKSIVYGVAFSPKGDLVASGAADMTVRIWDVASGSCRKVLPGHGGNVYCVAYSPSGNQIASCSEDHTVRLWNLETEECSRILSGHSDNVFEIAYSPHGDQIASASKDKTIQIWDVETGDCRRILNEHTSDVCSVVYSPKGDQVASSSLDATVRIWDVETGTCRHTLTGHRKPVYIVSYSPKGDKVASGSDDKTLRLWDASTGASRLVSSGHSAAVVTIKCSPTKDMIASGSMDNTIRLWDIEAGDCRRTLTGHSATVFCVAYSPLGDRIVSGSENHSVRLWRVDSGECQQLTGHAGSVFSVAFSPDGDTVASASNDNTVRLWAADTGDCSRILIGHTDGVTSVVYASDGRQIATGSKDCTVRLWDVDTGESTMVLKGHENWVRHAIYSPQGQQLASSSDDRTVRLWDLVSGQCRFVLTGHGGRVMAITYSADGMLLASGSWDKTVRLWDASSGEFRTAVQNYPDVVSCVAWCATSDANYLVAGCKDGSVHKWQVVEKEDHCRVQLQWSVSTGPLTVTGASIEGVCGLTQLDKRLLRQRGATGEPEMYEDGGMVHVDRNDM